MPDYKIKEILGEIAARLKKGKFGTGDLADLTELWVRFPDGSIKRVYPVPDKADKTPGDPEVIVEAPGKP